MRLRRVRKAMKSEPARIRLHESGERCIAGKRGHRPQPWRRIDGRDVPQNFTLPHSKAQMQGTRAAAWSRVFDSGHLHAKGPPFDHSLNGSGVCAFACECALDAGLGQRKEFKGASLRDGRPGSGNYLNLSLAFLCGGYRLLAHLPRTLRPAGLWCVTVFDAVVLI